MGTNANPRQLQDAIARCALRAWHQAAFDGRGLASRTAGDGAHGMATEANRRDNPARQTVVAKGGHVPSTRARDSQAARARNLKGGTNVGSTY